MQPGSYKVTARPASTTRCCTDRQTTNQQPGHPNRGVSRKQESGHLPVADILTVEFRRLVGRVGGRIPMKTGIPQVGVQRELGFATPRPCPADYCWRHLALSSLKVDGVELPARMGQQLGQVV
jgi:hypothetical protein